MGCSCLETAPEILRDVVALDETFVGGKNKNRHADKKIPNSQGRSEKGKTTVLGARGLLGTVKTKVIPSADSEHIKPVIEQWVEKGSIMVTDEWTAYNSLKNDYFHITVNHSEGVYVSGVFSSNGLENYWSILKRGIIGTFHFVSPKHLQKYCDEFTERYNKRDISNIERFIKSIEKCDNNRLTYQNLISPTAQAYE